MAAITLWQDTVYLIIFFTIFINVHCRPLPKLCPHRGFHVLTDCRQLTLDYILLLYTCVQYVWYDLIQRCFFDEKDKEWVSPALQNEMEQLVNEVYAERAFNCHVCTVLVHRQRYFPVCLIETVMINVAFGRCGKSAFEWLCRGAARSKYLLFLNTVNRLLHWFFHVIEWTNDNCTYMYTRVENHWFW